MANYATETNVQDLLTAFDLTDWLSAGDLYKRITSLLPEAKLAVDQAAGRNFDLHTAVALTTHGTGTAMLPLYEYGVYDLVSVASVVENDVTVEATDYALFPQVPAGVTRQGPSWLMKVSDVTNYPGYDLDPGKWTKGTANIDLVLTYGPTTPPADAVGAQAQLVGARILAECRGGAIADAGAVQSKRLGDFDVSYGVQNPWRETIEAWVNAAEGAFVNKHRGMRMRAI